MAVIMRVPMRVAVIVGVTVVMCVGVCLVRLPGPLFLAVFMRVPMGGTER